MTRRLFFLSPDPVMAVVCMVFLAAWVKFVGAAVMMVGLMTHNWVEISKAGSSEVLTMGLFKHCNVNGSCKQDMDEALRGR